MGESAGAAAGKNRCSIQLQKLIDLASVIGLSPLTRGLAHQIIALSGSSTAGWAIHRYGEFYHNFN